MISKAVALYRLMLSVWTMASEKHVGLIAAGVAFFGIFGIFPGIAAVIAIFGLMADPVIVGEQLKMIEGLIPPDAYNLMLNQINSLTTTEGQTLGWATFVSIVLALWSCRLGVAALIGGLNAIAGQRMRKGWWQLIVALMLTVALVTLAIVALFAVVVLPLFLQFIPVANSTAWLLEAARWFIALFALLSALSLLYRFGPARVESRGRWLTIGAVVVVIVWIAASVGLSFYLTNFASYNEVYGSIGAVIGLLLWLYVSAYLILLGAALNVHVHGVGWRRRPQTDALID